MAKKSKMNRKTAVSAKKTSKKNAAQSKMAEYIDNLLELHKLQGTVLTMLRREIQADARRK